MVMSTYVRVHAVCQDGWSTPQPLEQYLPSALSQTWQACQAANHAAQPTCHGALLVGNGGLVDRLDAPAVIELHPAVGVGALLRHAPGAEVLLGKGR